MIHSWPGRLLGVTCALLLSGCSVTSVDVYPTSPSATTQLLVFRALERAVAELDLARLKDRKVVMDVVSQLYDHRFAETYLETWLRAHGITVGGDNPDLRLQVYLLTLGTDKGQSFIGIPSFQVPVLSVPVPEIALFKWVRNRGHTEVQVFLYDPRTDEFLTRVPDTVGRAKYDDFTLLIIFGYTVTDLDKHPHAED